MFISEYNSIDVKLAYDDALKELQGVSKKCKNRILGVFALFISIQKLLKAGTYTVKKVTFIGMFSARNHFCTIFGIRDISV